MDYHCGNGTSSVFYSDASVLFISIHCDPEIEYPFNQGYADQIGLGEGEGTNLHIPLAPGATWKDAYKSALEKAMKAIVEFDAAGLTISLGLDTYEGVSSPVLATTCHLLLQLVLVTELNSLFHSLFFST